jgi:hypothetical protein
MGVGGQRHALAALPPGKTRYPLNRRLGGPQGRSGQVRKISPPPGFDPRTVQPVASRYTDWANRPVKKMQQSIFKTKLVHREITFKGEVTSLGTDSACCSTPDTPRPCGGSNRIWFLNLSRQDLSYHYLRTPFSGTDSPELNSAHFPRLPSTVLGFTDSSLLGDLPKCRKFLVTGCHSGDHEY